MCTKKTQEFNLRPEQTTKEEERGSRNAKTAIGLYICRSKTTMSEALGEINQKSSEQTNNVVSKSFLN